VLSVPRLRLSVSLLTQTRAEAVWRSQARKMKQQTDTKWKAEVSKKLEDLSELQGLRKDIWRIVVVLEKLAGIGG